MSAGRLWFGTNWKMNKTAAQAAEYAARLSQRLDSIVESCAITVFVIPPYTSIQTVRSVAAGKFWVGAQNMHWAECGPYTGEISAPMLSEVGVDLVQIGHAERRRLFNETDPDVNRKVLAALQAGLRCLLCVGENADDKRFGVERTTVVRQLRIALHQVPAESANRLLIAYEPWWAIGEGSSTAGPDYVRSILQELRNTLESLFGRETGCSVPVLYGGSVSRADAPAMLRESGVNGLFVGRAALDADDFLDLISSCLQP
jgi:triosephosphate isomerase